MNLFVCAYNRYREDESCYEILGFHHVLIDATLGHIPYLSGSFGGGRFVQTILIEDMSPCYDIFGLHHVYVDVILGHTPLTSPLLSSVQEFKLRLYMDQMFRLHLHHIH